MKTSKKLFIAFFVFLVLIIISFSYPGKDYFKKIKNESIQNFETINFQKIKYLKIEKDCTIQLSQSENEKPYFFYIDYKDSVNIKPVYIFSGDTLVVKSTKSSYRNGMWLNCQKIQGFIVHGHLELFNGQKDVDAVIKNGRLTLQGNNYQNLNIKIDNGSAVYWGKGLKHVNAHLNKGKLEIENTILKDVTIDARNKSRIRLKANNMVSHCDNSSRFY